MPLKLNKRGTLAPEDMIWGDKSISKAGRSQARKEERKKRGNQRKEREKPYNKWERDRKIKKTSEKAYREKGRMRHDDLDLNIGKTWTDTKSNWDRARTYKINKERDAGKKEDSTRNRSKALRANKKIERKKWEKKKKKK